MSELMHDRGMPLSCTKSSPPLAGHIEGVVKMSEQEFWQFLEGLLAKGRVTQVIGAIGCAESQDCKYLHGHALLPKDYDKISEGDTIKMGSLLFESGVQLKTKEAILMILAHQPTEVALTLLARYNLNPDKELDFFAEMALEECAYWNED